MIPKMLTESIRGAILYMDPNNQIKRKETEEEVKTYIDRIKYAIESGSAQLNLIKDRNVDKGRDLRYSNGFTLGDLFPNEDYVEVLKKELIQLSVENYIETVKDIRYPKRSEMRVFGKEYYCEDVYIKIRVELVSAFGGNHIKIMSFHYSDRKFVKEDFPYRKTGECNEEDE